MMEKLSREFSYSERGSTGYFRCIQGGFRGLNRSGLRNSGKDPVIVSAHFRGVPEQILLANG